MDDAHEQAAVRGTPHQRYAALLRRGEFLPAAPRHARGKRFAWPVIFTLLVCGVGEWALGACAQCLTSLIGAYALAFGLLLIILAFPLRRVPHHAQFIHASRASRV